MKIEKIIQSRVKCKNNIDIGKIDTKNTLMNYVVIFRRILID